VLITAHPPQLSITGEDKKESTSADVKYLNKSLNKKVFHFISLSSIRCNGPKHI